MSGGSGRRAVVTGAARGIGATVARSLAAEGLELVLVDLDPGVEAVAQELGAEGSLLDVTDEEGWRAALGRRRLDLLVNCAGILGPAAPVEKTSLSDWSRVLAVNLTGVFISCRAAIPAMRRAGGGRIVNLASIAGKEGNPTQAAYSASKAGVIGFTKSLAREVAADGIYVNCIAPTVVEGPLADAMTAELKQEIAAKIPMGRFCAPDEVAAMVAWLASPACSFTTGFCFDLSGGRATY